MIENDTKIYNNCQKSTIYMQKIRLYNFRSNIKQKKNNNVQ